MKISMPVYCGEIAPCFEAAEHFNVYDVSPKRALLSKQLECTQESPMLRVRILKAENIELLICGGISNFYRDILEADGLIVISEVAGKTEEVLEEFLNLNHIMGNFRVSKSPERCGKPLSEITSWVSSLLTENSYKIIERDLDAVFPVDISGRIDCPVCGKEIRIAVCCGSHTYSAEKEIKELYFVASGKYDALIYVHQTTPDIKRICSDYNIELLDPYAHFRSGTDNTNFNSRIPLINNSFSGHERAFVQTEK